MIYFTSDWHLGEDRIGMNGKPNLFYRPFKSIDEQNRTIIENFKKVFKDGDTLWHLGDVIYGRLEESEHILKDLRNSYPNSTFNLILGNYDVDKKDLLSKYFDFIYEDLDISLGNFSLYLNHYPSNCIKQLHSKVHDFCITGHIHSLWKVQECMINVGVDAWHFNPVSEEEILFCWNAMNKFYDENVFPYKNPLIDNSKETVNIIGRIKKIMKHGNTQS